jgi:hypothetical protein
MDEIVYTETRPGVMETSQEQRLREDRNFRRWDSAGRWYLPVGLALLTALEMLSEWI